MQVEITQIRRRRRLCSVLEIGSLLVQATDQSFQSAYELDPAALHRLDNFMVLHIYPHCAGPHPDMLVLKKFRGSRSEHLANRVLHITYRNIILAAVLQMSNSSVEHL